MIHSVFKVTAVLGCALSVLLPLASAQGQQDADAGAVVIRSHAIAMHGEPKYGPEFTHFDYVNPQAPKGGRIRLGSRARPSIRWRSVSIWLSRPTII